MANSYNELFGLGSHSPDASLEGWWPCQDFASNTIVEDYSGNNRDGAVGHGDNTNQYSTTGVNNWLTRAFQCNANLWTTLPNFTNAISKTLLARGYMSNLSAGVKFFIGSEGNTNRNYVGANGNTNVPYFRYGNNTAFGSSATSVITDNAWFSYASSIDSSYNCVGYVDGSSVVTASLPSTNGPFNTNINLGSYNDGQTAFMNGSVADASFFSRVLTSSEVAEWNDGPEPVNTVAPTLSRTETIGRTLTATPGTWALGSLFASGSNGTITYSYQWYRADDVTGTNRTAISGETSTTYTLTSADAGKHVQVQVRATNTGGFDSDADTSSNYTSVIVSKGKSFLIFLDL